MAKLESKSESVTGVATEMGKEIVKLYAKEGAKVIVADYNAEGAEAVSQEITFEGGTAKPVTVNVADAGQIEDMIDAAISEFGELDILVNNAGIMDSFEPVGEITDE